MINPYKGCEHACLYCYVRSNKTTAKESRAWGAYVDARVNAPELLAQEIRLKKPRRVLLGSTTECFQPAERRFGLTRKILRILNESGVEYVILTRSPSILDILDLLKSPYCAKIYFTVNLLPEDLKRALEPRSPALDERISAVNQLLAEGVSVVPYVSPILPGLSHHKGFFRSFPEADHLEFEGLNFNLGNFSAVAGAVVSLRPELEEFYQKMRLDRVFYESVWRSIRAEISQEAAAAGKSREIYIHHFGGYFENTYQ